jgi:hypothetical protein
MIRKSILAVIVLFAMVAVLLCEPATLQAAQIQSEVGQAEPVAAMPLEVRFSHNAGFYSEQFELGLFSTENAVIYYTLDGYEPTFESSIYTEPILVRIPEPAMSVAPFDREVVSRVDVLSVKAIAVLDGEVSQTAARNFVKGTDVFERFSPDTLVFTLNSDPHGLYDHNHGILIEGIDREQWHRENPGRNPDPTAPANFNRRGQESERAVFVEMFNSSGTLHISQRAGMRVKGGWSRARSQKSLELYARDEYGDRNNFLFPFFGEEHSMDGQIMNRYRRVRLRNGGNGRDQCYIRDELGQELLRQAGFTTTQKHTPAAVFLNGEYYGAAWLKTPRTENHWGRLFGGDNNNFEHIGTNEEGWSGEWRAVGDWQQIRTLAAGGLVDETRWEEFNARVDVDNLILYYAFQTYINNEDWPQNNMEMWRYFPGEEEEATGFLDGRWRFIPQDVEFSWGLYDNAGGSKVNFDTIAGLLGDRRRPMGQRSDLLIAVLARDDMRAKFANTLVDLMEGALDTDNVIAVLDDLISRITPELHYALIMNMVEPHELWWPSSGSVNDSRNLIRDFARNRPQVMFNSIGNNLGFNQDERFVVNFTTMSGGGALMHSRPVEELQQVTGNYFYGTAIEIAAKPYPGYAIDYWLVNGTRFTDDTLLINRDSTVELFFKRCPDYAQNGELYISEIKARGDDWIVIRNDTGQTLSTKGLYLSSSNSDFFRWQMPAVNIAPDSSLLIPTRSNNRDQSIKRVRANFNVSFGERVRLTDAGGNVISLVEVTLMNRNEAQRRMRDGRYSVVELWEVQVPVVPQPSAPVHVVEIKARESNSWNIYASEPIEITGAGEYSGTINFFDDSQDFLIGLTIMSQGGSFLFEPQGWANAVTAPREFSRMRIRVDSVIINGTIELDTSFGDRSLVISWGSEDSEFINGHTDAQLWNGWFEPNDRLIGVERVPLEGSDGFGFSVGVPINEIEVVFTVFEP